MPNWQRKGRGHSALSLLTADAENSLLNARGPEQQRGKVVERRGKGNLECSLVEAGMTSTGPSLRGIKLLTLNRRLLEGLKGLEGLERWNYAGARRSWE
jgi:hypothetical protein